MMELSDDAIATAAATLTAAVVQIQVAASGKDMHSGSEAENVASIYRQMLKTVRNADDRATGAKGSMTMF